MRFIRRGGRVIPINDRGGSHFPRSRAIAKATISGAKSGALVGAAGGIVGVGAGAVAARGMNHLIHMRGGSAHVTLAGKQAIKFIGHNTTKWAALGAAFGGTLATLRGKKDYGKSKQRAIR